MKQPMRVLALAGIPDSLLERLALRFDVLDARGTCVAALAAEDLRQVRGIACTGRSRLGEDDISRMAALSVVSSYSAGLDGIDAQALARRNIPLFNTSAVLAGTVANLAVCLTLALTRNLVQADRFVRSGAWRKGAFPLATTDDRLRVGILGFGHIGSAIARRLHGFDFELAYCATARKDAVPLRFFPDPHALAGWSDVLVVACAATPQTRASVDARVLRALGPGGALVNIARGSIVDEEALLAALSAGVIGGAALDVFADEPNVPAGLTGLDNVILTPHIGSGSASTREAMAAATVDALSRVLEPHRG